MPTAQELDLREEGGPSQERAPRRWLFLPSSDSAGSLEEEERVAGPSQDKGKGRALASEEVLSVGIQTQWGTKGDVKEGLELTPMGSFDVTQGGHQLWT